MFKSLHSIRNQDGKAGYLLMWLLGVPLPLLLVFYLFFH